MDAKRYLRQLKKLDIMITNKLIEKRQWQSIATGSGSISNLERVQASANQQKMENAILNYIDIQTEIDNIINQLIYYKQEIITVIEKLNTTDYDILHKHYVQYLDLSEIATIYDKSYSWVTTKHGRALQKVQAIIDAKGEVSDVTICDLM